MAELGWPKRWTVPTVREVWRQEMLRQRIQLDAIGRWFMRRGEDTIVAIERDGFFERAWLVPAGEHIDLWWAEEA